MYIKSKLVVVNQSEMSILLIWYHIGDIELRDICEIGQSQRYN